MSTFKARNNSVRFGVSYKTLLATSALTTAGLLAMGVSPARAGDGPVGDYDVWQFENIAPSQQGQGYVQYTGDRLIGNLSQEDIGRLGHVDLRANLTVATGVESGTMQILGALTSTGDVYVYDVDGILFGADSRVDIVGNAGFIAGKNTGINFDDNGGVHMTADVTEGGKIENNGMINVGDAGLAAFVAPNIVNNGVINAKMGTVALAAGEKATLDMYGDGLFEVQVEGKLNDALIENKGTIAAEGGTVQVTALAAKDAVDNIINIEGVVTVASATQQGGKIVLSGGDAGVVKVAGTVDASGTTGGKVNVTGKNILVEETAEIKADGGKGSDGKGNGGDVYVFADNAAIFRGNISARGGENGGNGGDAEVSGKNYVGFLGLADLRGVDGAGTLLIDPTRVDIVAGPGAQDAQVVDGVFTEATLATTQIGWDKIVAQLGLGNFTITTAGSGTQGDPDISIQAGRTYNSANTLTLLAHDNVDILNGSDVINTGTGGITLVAGWDGTNTTTPGFNGTVEYGLNDINFNAGGSIVTGGALTLRAENSLIMGADTLARGATVNIEVDQIDLNTGSSSINATAGAVTINRVTDGFVSLGSGAPLGSTTNLSITQTEAARITAQNLVIGSNGVNKITGIGVNGLNTQSNITGAVTLNAGSNAIAGVADANSNNVVFDSTNAFNGLNVNANDSIGFLTGQTTSNGAVNLTADTNAENVGLLQVATGASLVTSDDNITYTGNEVFIAGTGYIDATGGDIILNNKGIFASQNPNSLRTSGDGKIALTVWDANIGATVGSIQNAINALQNTNTAADSNTLTLKKHAGNAGVTAGDGTFDENLDINQTNLKIDGFAADNIRILGNNGGAAIVVNASGFNLDPVIVDGGGVATYGVSASGPAAAGMIIDGNIFRNFTTAGVFVGGAINGTVDIKNNTFENTSTRGVQIDNLSGATTDVEIVNNDMGTAALRLFTGVDISSTISGGADVTIHDNDIFSTDDSIYAEGDISGAGTTIVIAGNRLNSSTEEGVDLDGITSGAVVRIGGTDRVVGGLAGTTLDDGNTIVAAGNGIEFDAGVDSNVTVQGNKISASYGIVVADDDAGDTTSVANNAILSITNNDLGSDGADIISNAGVYIVEGITGTDTEVEINSNNIGRAGAQVVNGVLIAGVIDGGAEVEATQNVIRSTSNGISFAGNINGSVVQSNLNDIIATAGHAIHFGGNITNNLTIVNGNTQLDAEQDGVHFAGNIVGGNTQVSANSNISADDNGIYFGGTINGGAGVHIHDNVIKANLDGGTIGSGIWFNGNISDANINIGDGNNTSVPAWDGSNIISVASNFDLGNQGPDDGLDGIHFQGNVGTGSNIKIDGNRIGYTGTSGVGPVAASSVPDDGINFVGTVSGDTTVTISDNQMQALDNGVIFDSNVGGGGVTRVIIGGQDAAEHGNTINAGNDGVRFNAAVTGEALIEASNNLITATRDAIRFEGNVNNAKTTGGLSEEEINIYKNYLVGGQNGIHFVGTVTGVANDVRIHDNGTIIGTAGNGIVFDSEINDADVQIYANGNSGGAVRGGQNGVLFSGAINNNALVEVRDNGVIQGLGADGVRFNGPVNGSVVNVNGNDQILAFEDGVSFNGPMGASTINVIGNYGTGSTGIQADDHGIYFDQNINNGMTINIHDNRIEANRDLAVIGSGIFFNGTIQNATINIGDGGFGEANLGSLNGSNFIVVRDAAAGDENDLDGIHFHSTIGQNAVINIDGNYIGFTGTPNTGISASGNPGDTADDGIEFRGAVNRNARVNITDTWINAEDDGVRFFGSVAEGANVKIGGTGDGNYIIGFAGHGVVFENTIQDQALIDINSNSNISGGLDGIAFEGQTSNALLPGGASQQEINIADNNITGGNNGIRFAQNIDTDLHDIRIAGNNIRGNTLHGILFNGNIGGNESQIWIVDGNEIYGDDDGIRFQGNVTDEAEINITGNDSIEGNTHDGIYFNGTVNGATVRINNNDHILADNSNADHGIEFNGAITDAIIEILGNNEGIEAIGHGIVFNSNITNSDIDIHDNIINADTNNNGNGDGIRFGGMIQGNTTINIGDGDGLTLLTNPSNVISGVDGIHFADDVYNQAQIVIDGNRIGYNATSTTNPLTTGGSRVTDDGIEFADSVYDASNITITDNWIRSTDDGVRFASAYGTGKILIGGVDDRNTINSSNGDGIQFGGALYGERLLEISFNDINANNDGVRFTGQTSNALNPVTVQDEIWINENTIVAGRHGVNVEQDVSENRHDIRITANSITGASGNGIRFGGLINDESQVWILDNDLIRGYTDGIYVNGTVSGDALVEIVGNTRIEGLHDDAIDFNGNIFGNAVVRINENENIRADNTSGTDADNGIEFAGVGGASTIEILRNNHGIHSNNHGIYFGGIVGNAADIDIHDNIINADDNNNGTGDGIHFAQDIENQATVNIGDGNGSTFGNDPSNIISGHDGIHFAGNLENQVQIVIDGNRLGFDGTTLAGPYFNDRLGDDGIQVEGELRNQASFIVTDNHIRANGDGVSLLDNLENEAYVLIGGAGDKNTIDAQDDGIQFEGNILNSSLINISYNEIDADADGVRFDGDTSNADGIFPFRDDEILIANNDIVGGDNGISFYGRASGSRHDIRIEDNTRIIGQTEHGILHVGGIDAAELWILDNDSIYGWDEGIEINGNFFNGAHIEIADNTDVDSGFGAGITLTDFGGSGGADLNIINNHVHWTGDDGIQVENIDGTYIYNNTVHNTGGDGIQVRNSDFVTIDDNTIYNAGDDGIDLEDSFDSQITNNDVSFVDNNGIEINDSSYITVDNNDVADADDAGIFIDPSHHIFVTNNRVLRNDIGLYAQGGGNGYIEVTGNTFTDNEVGARFESGIIDLTNVGKDGYGNKFIGGVHGMVFDAWNGIPQQLSLVRTGGMVNGYTYDGNVNDTWPATSTPVNFGGTIGEQYFEGQSTSFVTLRRNTFTDLKTDEAIWLDASDSTYYRPGFGPFSPADTGDILTQDQLDFLEGMFRHRPDATQRGIFWFGALAPDAQSLGLENVEDFFKDFDPFNNNVSGLNLVITGLPRVTGFGLNLNNITPFAGGAEDVAGIEPAAGGDGTQTATATQVQDIEPAAGGEDAACWGQVLAAAVNGAVSYNFSTSAEEALADTEACGGAL